MIADRIHCSSVAIPASPLSLLLLLVLLVAVVVKINQCCPVPAGCSVRRCISACCTLRCLGRSSTLPCTVMQVAASHDAAWRGVGSILQLLLVPPPAAAAAAAVLRRAEMMLWPTSTISIDDVTAASTLFFYLS